MLHRISHGYFVQRFDEKEKRWVDQEFVSTGDYSWETAEGEPVEIEEILFDDPALPTDAAQYPHGVGSEFDGTCPQCGSEDLAEQYNLHTCRNCSFSFLV